MIIKYEKWICKKTTLVYNQLFKRQQVTCITIDMESSGTVTTYIVQENGLYFLKFSYQKPLIGKARLVKLDSIIYKPLRIQRDSEGKITDVEDGGVYAKKEYPTIPFVYGKFLQRRKANEISKELETYLSNLVTGKSPALMQQFLMGNGFSIVHLAAMIGDFEFIKRLKRIGFSMNTRDQRGRTPIHIAAACNNDFVITDIINFKLKSKSAKKYNIEDYDGNTPFYLASSLGNFDAARMCMWLMDFQPFAPNSLGKYPKFEERMFKAINEELDIKSNSTMEKLKGNASGFIAKKKIHFKKSFSTYNNL